MASNQTEHFGFNLWDRSDAFRVEEINENTEKIEGAMRQTAEAVEERLGQKTGLLVGTYVGDGQYSRSIDLGVTPKAVIIWHNGTRQYDSNGTYGGVAFPDRPSSAVAVNEGGFTVYYYSSSSYTNSSGNQYFYIALY